MRLARGPAAVALLGAALLVPAGAAVARTAPAADGGSAVAATTWHQRHLAGVWRFPASFETVPPPRVRVTYRVWRFVEEYDEVCYRVLVERDVVFRAVNGATILQLLTKRPGQEPAVRRVGAQEAVVAANAYRYFLVEDRSQSDLCPADTIDYAWVKVYTDRQRTW